MPELPEVQTVVDTLRPGVVGRRFVTVALGPHDVVSPDKFDLITAIRGRRVEQLVRRAKRIVFSLDDGHRFFIHLGMTGQLTVEPADATTKKHTHLVITLDDRRQLRFVDPRRFGEIRWLGDAPDELTIGPEPLVMRVSTLARQLAKTNRAVKVALLDQRVIAGIGNIYADEILHAARIRPERLANTLKPSEITRLHAAIGDILGAAIEAGGSTLKDTQYVDIGGEGGWFQTSHRVYDRGGQPCLTCGKAAIARIVSGGRTTSFCPRCQK
jgi:formamidopyrimidine-DNA glycosylase